MSYAILQPCLFLLVFFAFLPAVMAALAPQNNWHKKIYNKLPFVAKDFVEGGIKTLSPQDSEGTQGSQGTCGTLAEGQTMDLGCRARCQCKNGNLGCVDKCPASFVHHTNRTHNCRQLSQFGKCCATWQCDILRRNHKVGCVNTKARARDREDLSNTNDDTPMPGSFSLRRCSVETGRKTCSDLFCPVVVLAENWFLSSDWCNQIAVVNGDQLFVQYSTTNSTAGETMAVRHVHRSPKPAGPEGLGLVLLETEQTIALDRFSRPVNLPLSLDHCQRISDDGCSAVIGQTSLPDHVTASRRLELNTLQCSSRAQPGPNPEDRIWIHVKPDPSDPCGANAQPGQGVIVTSGVYDYLIGMTSALPDHVIDSDWQKQPQCMEHGCMPALNICPQLSWIEETTNNKRLFAWEIQKN